MTEKEIQSAAFSQILDPAKKADELDKRCADPAEAYQRETARMLVHTWKAYQTKRATLNDFLLVLRDFLNVFNTSWPASLLPIPQDNAFGIYKGADGDYYATRSEMDSHIPVQFLEDIYSGKRAEKRDNAAKYNLTADSYIENLTGFRTFRSEAQKLAVYGALKVPDGWTALITLPTGGGKSLITQSLAFQKPGLTIVVMPTVSLTLDQKRASMERIHRDNLNECIQSYTGGDDDSVPINLIAQKKLRMLFISPETLMRNPRFREALNKNASWIQNIVIDEAHLAVEWGDMFRPDFQCLQGWRKDLLLRNPDIRTFLMSATLKKQAVHVLKDLFSDREQWLEIRCDALRREPRISTILSRTLNERNTLSLKMVRTLPHPMIVYVNSPEEAAAVKGMLNKENLTNFELFTGETRTKDREKIIRLWADGDLPLIIATNAFGVGVDKPNIRTVLHLNLPTSVNSYYQELGRGGRDGLACLSVMDLVGRSATNRASAYGEAFGKASKRVLTAEKIIDRWEQMFLKNAQTVRGKDGYLISTAVLPGYQKDKDETGAVSQKNIQWNVNVLLLLKRHNLIDIQSIELVDQTYLFWITIKDDRLRAAGPELTERIEEIRKQEVEAIQQDLLQLWEMVTKASQKKGCWVDLFTDCYPLADEYCAGCPSHIEPERDWDDSILQKNLDGPLQKPSNTLTTLTGGREEFLVISQDLSILSSLQKAGMRLLVSSADIPVESIRKHLDPERASQIVSFEDYKKLQKYPYFVSGLTGILYSPREKKVEKEFRKIRSTMSREEERAKQICLAHIVHEDFYMDSYRKYLSELVQGPRIEPFELWAIQKDNGED